MTTQDVLQNGRLLEIVVDLCHVPDDDEQVCSLGYSCIHLVLFEGNYII